jgi:peptidoglycan/xylan/chitin deacetylase (PgdA/CDA1 family)
MTTVAILAFVVVILMTGLVKNITQLASPPKQPSETIAQDPRLYNQLRLASSQIGAVETAQAKSGVAVVSITPLEQELASARVDLESTDPSHAQSLLTHLQGQLETTDVKLAASAAGIQPPANPASLNVPIVLYHQPPTDFVTQMDILQQRGYTTITLDQLAAALIGKGTLPSKPVVITFDDGLASQLPAAGFLAIHHMKATFFIIDGGAASDYCIGANRHPGPCGNAYLTWSQIKQLDRNPLFTIASHTVDHLDLAQQTPAVQEYQIISGKQQLEQELGHRVDDFAYPYGDFNATTLSLVHQAGFIAAVTTTPGTTQTANSLLTLSRIRATYNLP